MITLWHFSWSLCSLSLKCDYPLTFFLISVFFISEIWLPFDISLDLCVLYLWNVITLWHFSWSLCSLSLKCDCPLTSLLISVFFISEMWLPFDIFLDLCVPYLWDINFCISSSWSLCSYVITLWHFSWSLCSLSLKCDYPLTFLLISVFFISEMWLPFDISLDLWRRFRRANCRQRK